MKEIISTTQTSSKPNLYHPTVFVHVAPPTSLQISTPSGPLIEDGNGIQKVIVFQNTLTSITCKSSGSRPEANVLWTLDTEDSSVNTTSSVIPNPDDASLYDTEGTLQILPERRHHNQTFRCLESFRTSRRYIDVLLLVYGMCILCHLVQFHTMTELPLFICLQTNIHLKSKGTDDHVL